MRIGIDIDGVLTDIERFVLDHISKYCVENNIEYKINLGSYNYAEIFSISEEHEDSFWEKWLFLYAKEEKARPFAAEVIKKLKEDGNEIYIVTARWLSNRNDEVGVAMRKAVKKWLTENKIIYDKLIFSNSDTEEKIQEMKDYKIDLMIEDSPKNINQLSTILPIVCFDTSYNRNCQGNNIYRCYSWYDIYIKIKGME